MTVAEQPPITGQTTLLQRDSFAFLAMMWLPRLLIIVVVVLFIVAAGTWLATLSEAQRLRFSDDPVAGFTRFMTQLGWVPIVFTVLFVLFLAAVNWLQMARLPMENRKVSYEANQDALITRDAAGAEFKLPWTMVRTLRPGKHLLILKLGMRVWRYVPWRAFAPEDRVRLLALAQARIAPQASSAAAKDRS
ncbi:hypothetical protein [Reyranella sp. CPCC 100927]|uniref:hypothetical protein n=1 Tax=Reyranella sp. CPCC 100927 TaxID=2599616 RepID=UPI0011B529A5|nr:hypothetical protein [Reyranella sp. CPCC 100927]TWT01241.1 hypothetical protein FQU96_32690 [Reyranella sp. CPCC 100927]